MSMLGRIMFSLVNFRARKGLSEVPPEDSSDASLVSAKLKARQTGIRGETYAYWYLRRQGYTLVARNYTFPGFKGEIDLVGYDGSVLAFVEVKTRSVLPVGQSGPAMPAPEDAVDREKRRNLARMARQFLRLRRCESSSCRFDILAIETRAGSAPEVRLHKGAFQPFH